MPEGDTLFRTATTLRKALLHRLVTRFETSVPTVATADENHRVAGRVVTAVEARGKHLLITFGPGERARQSVPIVLHSHLRMTGSWHIYRPGETWGKPAHRSVAVIHTDEWIAPCFSAPIVELLTETRAHRLTSLVELGPDAITEEFDAGEAFRRLRGLPDQPIGVAIMNQRLISGVGNVYKSEVLFLRRMSPFIHVRELGDAELEALIAEAHRLLLLNRERGERQTHFGLDQRAKLWVYGRSGQACRECGERIRMRRQGVDARSTYYCPRCQGVAT
jgi:endonuclease-8